MQAPVVFQQLDTNPILDTSVTNIPASGSALLQVVAKLALDCNQLLVTSQSDQFIGVYEGALLQVVIPPGWTDYLGVSLKAGSSISLRNMANTLINDGSLLSIQFAND